MTATYPWPQPPRGRGRYLYALIDPRDDRIRYIGKRVGYLNSRLRAHLYEARDTNHHTHKLAWLRQLLALGLEPRIQVIALFPPSDTTDLNALERTWIAYLRSIGCALTNSTAGGEGMEAPSEETRAKLRADRRARPPIAPHVRAAASAHMASLWADPEWRARQSRRSSSEEQRTKLREAWVIRRQRTAEMAT